MVEHSILFSEVQNSATERLPARVPDIRLHHGRAIWILSEAGFRGAATASTFNYYIKSLRKLGVPFAEGEAQKRVGRLIDYTYDHLMELAVVLTLRVYNVVPDALLREVGQFRAELHRAYKQAYAHRNEGIGAPIRAQFGRRVLNARGVFLDLQIEYAGGKLMRFGPPKLLTPFEALAAFADGEQPARTHTPIHLSALCERIVLLALAASRKSD